METVIQDDLRQTRSGQKANEILRKCVHCGFCNATCPTYQILGDERDGPRGRIYLIKSLLEGETETQTAQTHLDRCLTCRACETACPSGVEYGHLLEIGREQLAENISELSLLDRLYRWSLRKLMTTRKLFQFSIAFGKIIRPVLPARYRSKIPSAKVKKNNILKKKHARKVILFQGCVQPTLTPNTNIQTELLLDKLGIETISVENEQCCGALSHHLAATAEAKHFIKQNIDAWWPLIEGGAEAIISTASGCGVMLKDYAYLLADDPEYTLKAERVSELSADISEYIARLDLSSVTIAQPFQTKRLAFHSPCTLQHGQNLNGQLEELLTKLGLELHSFSDAHMCCGSAGAYSLLQPELSIELQQKKIQAIKSVKPDLIVTANIGCQMHLQEASDVPVKHWIELFEDIQ